MTTLAVTFPSWLAWLFAFAIILQIANSVLGIITHLLRRSHDERLRKRAREVLAAAARRQAANPSREALERLNRDLGPLP